MTPTVERCVECDERRRVVNVALHAWGQHHRVDALRDHYRFAAIVAMGGPMGGLDADTVVWLSPEIEYLREALAAYIPIWRVCLGAQLLAAVKSRDVVYEVVV